MFEGDDAQGIDKVFVLGNGPSRANIDPSKLDGTVIGCNACYSCLLYTSPSPRDGLLSRMPSSA